MILPVEGAIAPASTPYHRKFDRLSLLKHDVIHFLKGTTL